MAANPNQIRKENDRDSGVTQIPWGEIRQGRDSWNLYTGTTSGSTVFEISDQQGWADTNKKSDVGYNIINESTYTNYLNQIKSFTSLNKNWNTYDAEPPNDKAISNAIDALHLLKIYLKYPIRIGPSPEGGVSFEFLKEQNYIIIEFYNNEDIIFLKQFDGNSVVLDITEADLNEIIQQI